ncbi:serine hydrolase [Longimicrobium sp.]|uniref:serine hydrolase n=1 Tax=Longimicrobium sp. TaxID=2029185 RepID=UPI002D1049C0|nr:serine hydrolase [Longimicrobium sp.]HSU15402.1 serine hydrolase [Longimicrobium sp.]
MTRPQNRTDRAPAAPAPPRPRAAILRALALGLFALAAACGRQEPASPWSEARLARMTTRQKVAQLLMVRAAPLTPSVPPGDSSRARLLRWATDGVGGVEMTGGPARTVAALADTLRKLPLAPLVAARLDGGAGRVFPGATELPSAEGLMVLGDAELATAAGTAAAAEAKAMGIDLAFVAGPALPGDSSALAPPSANDAGTAAYAAFVRALAEGGRLPAISIFRPSSSEAGAGVRAVRWDRSALEVSHLDWLGAAVKAGAAAVQPGFVAVPALTGDTTPLPLSGITAFGILRRDMGFGGMVIADVAADGPLARRMGGIVPGAVAAIREGADLLAGVSDPAALADSLAAAVEAGRIPRDMVDQAVRRVFAAKRRAGLGIPPADTTRLPLPSREAVEMAGGAFERTAVALGTVPALAGCRATILITAPDADVSTLSGELAARVPNLRHLRTGVVARHGLLTRVPSFASAGADCAVVAEVGAARLRFVDRIGAVARRDTSKAARRDTAKFRADSLAFARDTVTRRIVYVALDADPARPLPAVRTAVLVFGAGARAQRAAVRALFGEIHRPADQLPHPRGAWPPARRLARGDAKDAGMSADSLAKIDAVMQRALDAGVFTSAAVAVGRHGKLVKLRGYGTVAGGPVDPANTLFDLASLTKVIGTTAAVMALVDDGKIRLDEPVYRYLPQFRGGGRGDVTVWNLMTHTGGLPAGDDLYNGAADADAALQMVYRTDLVYEPGTKMVYSDFGMILMAEVVRRRAGEPVDRFAARRVFVPLGMENTMYRPPLVWWGRTVPSAIRSERPYVLRDVVHDGNSFRLGGVAGHAGLFSTAGDLAIYAQTLLNLGAYGDRRIWSPRTVQRFTTRQLKVETRALGWDTPAKRSSAGDFFSARAFGHTGYTGTSIWIDPERDLFVVLLTNRVYDGGTEGQILAIRSAVSDVAARAITDIPITPRPGTAAAEARAAAERAAARARARANARKKRPVRRGRGTPRRTSTRGRGRG